MQEVKKNTKTNSFVLDYIGRDVMQGFCIESLLLTHLHATGRSICSVEPPKTPIDCVCNTGTPFKLSSLIHEIGS